MTHTPGPWSVFDSGDNPGIDQDEISSIIMFGENEKGVQGETREIRLANAKLIAAAPDLLAALELLDQFAGETVAELNFKCGIDNDTTTQTEVARDNARAAIAKAT